MSMTTRLSSVEDHNLTPREAVILWMREAHEFDSLLAYGFWLLDQPDDAYPLIRMPAQVVAAVRSRHKGKKDHELANEFHQVQRDVLFLYHIHKQLNMRAIADAEARQLKVQMLQEKLKGLINHIYLCNMARLAGFEFPDDLSAAPPERMKTKDELSVDEEILSWPMEEMLLWGEVMSFKEAERLLSARYFAGEELLYPDVRRTLDATLSFLAGMRTSYQVTLDMRPPESDKEFILWMARDTTEKREEASPDDAADDMPRPRVRRVAQAIAKHVVLVARAEALDDLGERDAGIRLVQIWMRSEEGLQGFEDARDPDRS
jgi:hypothetical protein